MKRWLPYPLLTTGIFVMWLLLTQSFSLGQILMGAIVALLASASMVRLARPFSSIRSWRKLAELAAFVTADVIRSNIAVIRIVLSPVARRNSQFVQLKLKLSHPQALTILALIITATPGTAWVQYSRVNNRLLIHVFDLVDEEAWIALIKNRYERLLLEAFEQ